MDTATAERPETATAHSKKLLVVEDNQDQLEGIMELLKVADYSVIGVSSGKEALEYIHQGIDLVVCDFHMGDLSGEEIIRQWLPREPETHFVILTADQDVSTAVTMMKSGATDYITKPVSPSRLLEVIGGVLHTC